MHTQVLQIGISKEKFKLWLMVKKETGGDTDIHRRRGRRERRYKLMQGIGLFNCYSFPVPAEKWGRGVVGAVGNTGKPVF